jgi:glycosyltransferase involved in cell wall biosynthesis
MAQALVRCLFLRLLLQPLTDRVAALHRLSMVESTFKKRVLLISSWFPADVGRRSLMSEFADAVVASGNVIDVVAIDWRDVDLTENPSAIHQNEGMYVYRFNPLIISSFGKSAQLIAKWVGTSLKAVSTTIRLLRTNDYDVIVAHAPSPIWAPVLICNLFSKSKKYLVQWDFVPYHQRALGMMSGGVVFNALLLLEKILVLGFDVIGCMSEMNITFLKTHYWIRLDQKVEILPIWTEAVFPPTSDRKYIRERYKIPLDKKIVIFGGTLSHGRGLEDIVAAARLDNQESTDILFLIVGGGPLENEVKKMIEGLANAMMLPTIPKQDYLKLLGVCDCGIVATQRDTGVPTFPHKTLDYFRAGIPVVASVENSTDFGTFLKVNDAAVVVEAGNQQALFAAVSTVCSDMTDNSERIANGKNLILEYFNVNRIIKHVLS